MSTIRATREQLIEWIRFKAGELSLRDVSDDTLVLMSVGLQPDDIVMTESGAYPVTAHPDRRR